MSVVFEKLREKAQQSSQLHDISSTSCFSINQAAVSEVFGAWSTEAKRLAHHHSALQMISQQQNLYTKAVTFLSWRDLWESHRKLLSCQKDEDLALAFIHSIAQTKDSADIHQWASRSLASWISVSDAMKSGDLLTSLNFAINKALQKWYGGQLLVLQVMVDEMESSLQELERHVTLSRSKQVDQCDNLNSKVRELESILFSVFSSDQEARQDKTPTMMERLSRNVFGTGKKSATAGVGILLDKTLASGEVVVKALLHGSVAKQSGIICQNDVLETVNGNELPQHPTLCQPCPS